MVDDIRAALHKNVTERELSVPADEGQLSRVRDFVTEVCGEAGFTTRETNNTKLAVDEACTNIIKHAYEEDPGDIAVRAEISLGDIAFRIVDSGKPFDFAGVKDPDLNQYVETGKKGGLGVFLINRLMDRVEYRPGDVSNELFLTKTSHAPMPGAAPAHISWRGSLRYKFTVQASVGFFVLISAIGAYMFVRQTSSLKEQYATQWMEKRRLAANLSNMSKELLINAEEYSVAQTTLTSLVAQMLEGHADLAYARVLDRDGIILSSGEIDEMFTEYTPPPDGEVLLREANDVVWTKTAIDGENVRDIAYPVLISNQDTGERLVVGSVHIGVYESLLGQGVKDPRVLTALIIVLVLAVGVFLIIGLVKVFVKPIQVLTDGVRAIGEGSLDGKISTEGPAEIGAIAAVFNEISEKFKKAQESVLEQEKMQKEIEVAKQIQQALLPRKHPDVSGYDIAPYYQAAKEVGGDYYDFVVVDEETLGVVVADVSGKGVPGSLVMTMIRTALRMEARGNNNASDVMSKMNDFVTDDMKKGMFVTMFYVILDSKNRIISYASAGHNPMILYRADSEDIFFLNPKGFPVGISLPDESLFRRSISLEKIKLKKDDMLLIYTDGVTEAMNERREQYGEDRLIELVKRNGHLHPTRFIEVLEQDVKTFTGGHPQNDDITVVAVKEKLAADDVLFGIRKKLIDLVEVAGMSVKEACAKMKVSPATYYRYKKRQRLFGDRGLKNKVLREDQDLKRVSIEERKAMIRLIRGNPGFGAKRIADEYNRLPDTPRPMTVKMIYDELRRLNLNTKELRLDYLRRHHLLEEPTKKTSKEMVEDLITEVAREAAADTPSPDAGVHEDSSVTDGLVPTTEEILSDFAPEDRALTPYEGEPSPLQDEVAYEGVRIGMSEFEDGPVALSVTGHLDSISSTALEKRLQDVIDQGRSKVIVDLTKVSYISSGGWGVMVSKVKNVQQKDGDVVIVGMASEVHDVYELLGFNEFLRSFATVEDGLEYLRRPTEERRPAEKPAMDMEPEESAPEPASTSLVGSMPPADTSGEWESLKIEAATVGAKADIAVLSLIGIIDTISAERLRSAIDRVIRSNICKIVVDLSRIEYVSSGGWGTFTERLRELRRLGGDVKLFGMDPDVYYIFTMLGFNIVLSSFDILSEAIEDFAQDTEAKPSEHPERQSKDDSKPPSDETASAVESGDVDRTTDDQPSSPRTSQDLVPTSSNKVVWSEIDGVLVVSVGGMIEASSVEEIRAQVDDKLASKPPFILFHLAHATYVSSTGWGIFAEYHQRVSEWGGKIGLCAMSPELTDIFNLLEFQSFVPSYATMDEGLSKIIESSPVEPERPVEEATVEDVVGSLEEPPAETHVAEPEPASEPVDVSDVLDSLGDDSSDGGPSKDGARDPRWDEPKPSEVGSSDFDSLATSQPRQAQQNERQDDEDGEFVDFDLSPTDVSIEQSAIDADVNEDSKIRDLGWDKYGERLKKASRNKPKKKPEKGDS